MHGGLPRPPFPSWNISGVFAPFDIKASPSRILATYNSSQYIASALLINRAPKAQPRENNAISFSLPLLC